MCDLDRRTTAENGIGEHKGAAFASTFMYNLFMKDAVKNWCLQLFSSSVFVPGLQFLTVSSKNIQLKRRHPADGTKCKSATSTLTVLLWAMEQQMTTTPRVPWRGQYVYLGFMHICIGNPIDFNFHNDWIKVFHARCHFDKIIFFIQEFKSYFPLSCII